jgi:hypothetical protein
MATDNSHKIVNTIGVVLPNGTMLDMIYDPKKMKGQLVKSNKDGVSEIVDQYQNPESGITYKPMMDDDITEATVILPQGVGKEATSEQLRDRIRLFFHRFVDLDEEGLNIVADFALLTYVYDSLEKVPYLKFTGPYGCGKSRALQVLRSICYHSISLGGSQTSAVLFRVVDKFRTGTVFLDEANFNDTARTSDIVKILNDGYDRNGRVERCDQPICQPRTFKIFSPKVIANHGQYDDPALESRMLTLNMRPTDRLDIPIILPEVLSWNEANEIRNDLLQFRIQNFFKITPDKRYKELSEFDSRLQEITHPLLWAQNQKSVPEYMMKFLRQTQENQRQTLMFGNDAVTATYIKDCIMGEYNPVHLLSEIGETIHNRYHRSITAKELSKHLNSFGCKSTRISSGMKFDLSTANIPYMEKRYGIKVEKLVR